MSVYARVAAPVRPRPSVCLSGHQSRVSPAVNRVVCLPSGTASNLRVTDVLALTFCFFRVTPRVFGLTNGLASWERTDGPASQREFLQWRGAGGQPRCLACCECKHGDIAGAITPPLTLHEVPGAAVKGARPKGSVLRAPRIHEPHSRPHAAWHSQAASEGEGAGQAAPRVI